MKIIIPMAGRGTRLRPHTLTVPKPLIPIVGKPIVHRLVEDLAKLCPEPVDEVAFIIGRDFGKEVEQQLHEIGKQIGAKASIYYQDEKLGTAHAIQCAKDSMDGRLIVAFADTLFRADFEIKPEIEGMIWVQKVEDPTAFGVVKFDKDNVITDFVEKPQTFVSDLAIIGIYYFKDGAYLREEIQYLIDNDIKDRGEYQITDALENMKNKGTKFIPGEVNEWLDCGNKDVTIQTNHRYLEFVKDQELVSPSAKLVNSVVIQPSFIGENVELHNSIVGPHVSIGKNTKIIDSIIKDSIIQENTVIEQAHLHNSMVGNFVTYQGKSQDLSLGDYNQLKV
jgi:glucose-1-phosphate thymidylyltransferase